MSDHFEKTTILLKRYARTISLDEDPDGFVLHLDDAPSPLESVHLSRDDVRTIARATPAAIGEESNDKTR